MKWLDMLADDESAAQLLGEVRWSNGIMCPRCGSDDVVGHGNYMEFKRYFCCGCDRTFNDKTGTVFEYSKVPLRLWYFSMLVFLRWHSSIRQLKFDFDCSYRTVYRLIESFLESIGVSLPKIEGSFEIDEVYVKAGRKGRKRDGGCSVFSPRSRGLKSRGRGSYESDKPPIIVLVERGSETRYAIPAKNADESTLRVILDGVVSVEDPPLTVYTDEYCSYGFLEDDDRFVHKTVVHDDGEYVSGDVHVNGCEGEASLVRCWLFPHRGLSKDKLSCYFRGFRLSRKTRFKKPIEALKIALKSTM